MPTNRTWTGTTDGDYNNVANWLEADTPDAGDDVRIPASSTRAIDTNLDQSAVVLASFIVEEGYAQTIGSNSAYLQINTGSGRFDFNGSGVSYIDLGNSTSSPRIQGTAAAATGTRGLYLKGSALTVIEVESGDVGLAVKPGETSAVTTARTVGSKASLWLGAGVTVTNVQQLAGKITLRAAATTVNVYGGTLTTEEAGAITTLNVYAGTTYPKSSGTITTLNAYGGTTDFTASGTARTVTTLAHNAGATVTYDPAVLTVTNRSAPTTPVRLIAQAP